MLASLVEGDGEVKAVPLLLRRIAAEFHGIYSIDVPRPHRLHRPQFLHGPELARALKLAGGRAGHDGGVLVLLDADDECPVECAATVAERCKDVVLCPVEVVAANREFEAWFLAGIESLRGHRSVTDEATFADNPDSPRGAKARLGQHMTERYRETVHQAAFSQQMDLTLARERSRSFRHLCVAVQRLLRVRD